VPCQLPDVQYIGQMTQIADDLATRIAAGMQAERLTRNWSLAELASHSGVSKAMLSAIERGETSPTAVLLVRIAAAFGMTLSNLIAQAEATGGSLARAATQPVWADPETGYIRRHLSPQTDMPLELVQVELPAGARVTLPASSYAFIRQQIWLIEGRLDFSEGSTIHSMEPGDCLALGPPSDCAFFAPGPEPALYLVAVVRRGH
jgi:transcriptional regulator with XRE-family HTH domain